LPNILGVFVASKKGENTKVIVVDDDKRGINLLSLRLPRSYDFFMVKKVSRFSDLKFPKT